jgi:CRISPR-associated protein Cas2
MQQRRYLVCYDIAHPRRLRLVANTVQSFGERIQYSIFECSLSSVQLALLKEQLLKIIELSEDQILFVSLLDRSSGGQDLIISSVGLSYTKKSLVSII